MFGFLRRSIPALLALLSASCAMQNERASVAGSQPPAPATVPTVNFDSGALSFTPDAASASPAGVPAIHRNLNTVTDSTLAGNETAFLRDTFTGGVSITLTDDKIDEWKNRATLDIDFTVDKALPSPHRIKAGGDDGDIHIAGRDEAHVKLPMVIEIMNAKQYPKALEDVHADEGNGQQIPVTGAWRIWAEHAGTSAQVQGVPHDAFDTTNPDHVFELHPVIKFGGDDVHGSVEPIDGYENKDAGTAFGKFESEPCRIIPRNDGTTTVVTPGVGYNYVEFIIELTAKQVKLDDGGIAVICSIMDTGGETILKNRRMIFAPNTKPFDHVQQLKVGDQMHVLGIPRLDLALVAWRRDQFRKAHRTDVLSWGLPYEMIIAGEFDREP